ncbi:MAG: phosphotransferase [Vicinamibacterales bacterium]
MNPIVAKITARFEADQRNAPKAVAPTDIPISYDAITSDWLTAILCRDVPGARVSSFAVGAPDDGVSNRRRIELTYNEAGTAARLPASVFCKAAQGLNNRLMFVLSGCGHAEATFYNKVRSRVDLEAPQSYWANFDPDSGLSIIVLRDMQDVEFCRQTTPITFDRVRSGVELLATLHGSSTGREWSKPGGEYFVTWPQFWANNMTMGTEEYCNRGFLAAEEVIPPRIYERFPEVWPATMRSVERHHELPQSLMHGDVHLRNWYIAAAGHMGLNDWQNCCVGNGSRDFAYFVSTALTIENRRAWEKELLAAYLARLEASGGPRTSFTDAWLSYRQQLLSALAYWTVTLTPSPSMPDMQPREACLTFIGRMAQAIEDHQSLDSFD